MCLINLYLGDGTVRVCYVTRRVGMNGVDGPTWYQVWETETFGCKYLIQSCHDVGDVFSVVYSEKSDIVFFGCQNTSIQVRPILLKRVHQGRSLSCFVAVVQFFGFGYAWEWIGRTDNTSERIPKVQVLRVAFPFGYHGRSQPFSSWRSCHQMPGLREKRTVECPWGLCLLFASCLWYTKRRRRSSH